MQLEFGHYVQPCHYAEHGDAVVSTVVSKMVLDLIPRLTRMPICVEFACLPMPTSVYLWVIKVVVQVQDGGTHKHTDLVHLAMLCKKTRNDHKRYSILDMLRV